MIDLDSVRDRMKALGIFDHEGYSGPATSRFTVTIRDGRFLIVETDEWFDDIEDLFLVLQKG